MKKLVIRTATVNDASLQAPPSPPKRSRKSLIALLVIGIAIVAAVAGASLIMRGPSASSNSNTSSNSNNNSIPVGNASSLKFSYSITSEGYSAGTFTYTAKNIGAPNLMIRQEYTTTSDNTIVIVNGVQHGYWWYIGDQWTDLSSSEYSGQVQLYNDRLVPFINDLKSWSGSGDYTYTAPNGDIIRYFNIAVNPTLADSLFQP